MSSLLNDVVSDVKTSLGVRETTINNKKFSLTLLPADEGLAVFIKLITLFGPSIASIADSARTEEYTMPEDDDVITQAVLHLVAKMSDIPDVIKLIMTLTREVKVDGKPIDFADYFKGNYGEMALVIEWCLMENFKDAFTSWLKAKGLPIPTLSQMFLKPNKEATSTEPSDE